MSRRAQAIVFGIVTALWVLASPFVLTFAALSVMISDAGANWAVYTAIGLAFAWPVVLVLGVLCCWIAYALKRPRMATAFLVAPAVWPVITILGWLILENLMPGRHG